MKGNLYRRAREEAAKADPDLGVMRNAADRLGVAECTLRGYELGNTKTVPPDVVMLMADLYNAPELKTNYCKRECPLGKDIAVATQVGSIEGITLRLVAELDPDRIRQTTNAIVQIAKDGRITEKEQPILKKATRQLDDAAVAIDELRLATDKILKGSKE